MNSKPPTPVAACSNAQNLEHGFDYLATVIAARQSVDCQKQEVAIEKLGYLQDESPFAGFIDRYKPDFAEYLTVLLALVVQVKPGFLERCFKKSLPEDGDYAEYGLSRDSDSRALFATVETVFYLVAGQDLTGRFEVQRIFSPEHWLFKDQVIELSNRRHDAPVSAARLLIPSDTLEWLTIGEYSVPPFSDQFPAREIHTQRDWPELVLADKEKSRLDEIHNWVQHHRTVADDWNMGDKIKPGYRALFCGPPGTGKTFTATLLGKHTGRRVFRVDLSAVVSKYIGETEKNLANLFSKAHSKQWILFFDEADALFGKRTAVQNSQDRFANQEVSFLLQRIEDFDGLILLATNLKANMDEAFTRRFNNVVNFNLPTAPQRQQIWLNALPAHCPDNNTLAEQLSHQELSGGAIMNAVGFACIQALAEGLKAPTLSILRAGIKRELEKEGHVYIEDH